MLNSRNPALLAILWGGLVAGTLDIGSASLINWLNPVVILHAIASGVLGKPSFYDGLPSAMLGLFLQWGMSLLIAAIFVVAARRLTWMTRRWLGAGIAFGVVVYGVMSYVVVPLSAAWPGRDFSKPMNFAKEGENLLAMFVFGLIIAFATQYFLSRAPIADRAGTGDAL